MSQATMKKSSAMQLEAPRFEYSKALLIAGFREHYTSETMNNMPELWQRFAPHYGYPESLIVVIGILEIACTLVYVIPQSSYLGAILMTAYLGGATASNVRVGDPSYFATVILGVLVWAGLYLRDARLRALLPLRR